MGQYWEGLSDKLQKLQKRVARIVTFSSYENHSSDLLDELGWQKVELKRLKQLAVVMYKVHNNLSPPYLSRIFTKTLLTFQVYIPTILETPNQIVISPDRELNLH